MPNAYGELFTSRLVLRPLELADSDQIQQLFPHWEIVKYLANRVPWPYPPDGAYRFICDVALPAIQRAEQWHWTIRLKSAPQQLIGSINLVKGDDANRGFWIGLPWQGQGLMTEAVEPSPISGSTILVFKCCERQKQSITSRPAGSRKSMACE